MAADPSRVLVVAACVLAVAVGGAALPATEYGGVPGSDVDAVDSEDPGGVSGSFLEGTPIEPSGTPADASTPTPRSTTNGTPTDTDSASTPTASPTTSPTPTPDDDRGDLWPLLLAGGLFRIVVLFLVVLIAGVALRGAVLLAERSGFIAVGGMDGLGDISIPNPLRAISARVTATTLSAPSATARLGRAVQEAIVGTGSALGGATAALGRAGRMQASALGALASALGGVGLGFSTSLSGLVPSFGREDIGAIRGADGGAGGGGGGSDGDGESSRLSIADAWLELRRLAAVSNPATRTPAEVARAAVDRGLPRGPVMRLTETFREVTYGRADPDGIRGAAVDALRSLRDAVGGGN